MLELGPILDVAIGMAFVFVLFALLVSTIFEAIASVLKLRAKALENALIRMIEDPQSLHRIDPEFGDGLLDIFRVQKRSLERLVKQAGDDRIGRIFRKVYTHPLVGGGGARNKPSYLAASGFASALLYVLREGKGGSLLSQIEQGVGDLPQGSLRVALETIIGEAQGDLAKIQAGVETWFDTTMARLSGAYKRFTQPCNLAIGLAAAIVLNVNAVDIAGKLYAEPGLRAALAERAAAYVKQDPAKRNNDYADLCPAAPAGQSNLQGVCQAEHRLLDAAPGVGWRSAPSDWTCAQWLSALLGWLITAFAGMMGGPFWFDTLQKLVNLRGTGPKPKTKAETAAKAA